MWPKREVGPVPRLSAYVGTPEVGGVERDEPVVKERSDHHAFVDSGAAIDDAAAERRKCALSAEQQKLQFCAAAIIE